jgi:hypothetical protein
MKQIITLTESELKRAVNKSIKKVLARPKRGWGDLGDHSTPERGYYYCEETDYSSGRVRRWIGDENDAKICRTCSEGGAYGPFNSRSDAVNFMKHFDKDYRERHEKIYGKGNKDDDYDEYCRKMDIECNGGSDAEDEDEIYGSYDELDESKIRRIVKESVRNVLNEGEGGYGNYSPEDLVAIAKAVVSVYGNGNIIPSNPNPSELAELLKYWEMEHGQTTDIYSAFKKMVTGGGW